MKRSITLLTVLLAFAIFAMPANAGPPAPYVMPVEVVNDAASPAPITGDVEVTNDSNNPVPVTGDVNATVSGKDLEPIHIFLGEACYGEGCSEYVVPSGKLLKITHISMVVHKGNNNEVNDVTGYLWLYDNGYLTQAFLVPFHGPRQNSVVPAGRTYLFSSQVEFMFEATQKVGIAASGTDVTVTKAYINGVLMNSE